MRTGKEENRGQADRRSRGQEYRRTGGHQDSNIVGHQDSKTVGQHGIRTGEKTGEIGQVDIKTGGQMYNINNKNTNSYVSFF